MRTNEMKEVTRCDHCGKEGYVTACMGCGVEHDYDCRKTQGKDYSHGVNFSGSGDGYYCLKCDAALTMSNKDSLHAAYRAVESLRLEARAWSVDFERRTKEAQERIERGRNGGLPS